VSSTRILSVSPVAVKHSKVKNEPIKDLFGNINSYLIRELLEQCYAGDESRIPTVEYRSQKPVTPSSVVFPFDISTTIVQGASYIDNPIRRLLAPRPDQTIVVSVRLHGPSHFMAQLVRTADINLLSRRLRFSTSHHQN